MKKARPWFYKPVLVALAIGLLASAFYSQRGLNRRRDELGLTRTTPLKNAPPLLSLTTVVLGGFRGLIANVLWVRAMELQDEDKYFEMVQLADWITKLQPHNATVWIVQAWNMSYNISIKFSDPRYRWMWVSRGIELLRDQGLAYNPHSVAIYRELGWHFQHKMGHNLDDEHLFYKSVWAAEMEAVLGAGPPDFEALINPTTEGAKERARVLREKYKLDPALMKEVDDQYGPLEWRLPETHAVYWGVLGKREARTQEELIQLRRLIYQSMYLAFHRGRLIKNKFNDEVQFGPNLDIIPKTDAAFREAMAEDEEMREHIGRAHKNFIQDAIYFLFIHNRMREANEWFAVLKEDYPSYYPEGMSLEAYALSRASEDAAETDMNKTISLITGSITQSYVNLALGETDRAEGFLRLAKAAWRNFTARIQDGASAERVGLPAMEEIRDDVLNRLLDPETGLVPEMADALRTALGLPADYGPAVSGTNAVSEVETPPAPEN